MRYYFFMLTLLLAGCSVGPSYKTPSTDLPSHWSFSTAHFNMMNPSNRWWRDFHDPLLNQLIEEKSGNNLNLKIAQARVAVANAEFTRATSQFFPTAGAEVFPPNGTGENITQVIALVTSLELDLFGRLRQMREQSKANFQAKQAMYDFTILNLHAEIASTYLELREAQTKDTILHHNIINNQQMLRFLNSNYKAGMTKYIDIAQQNALIETQAAEIEQNKALIIALCNKLELLTGSNPGGLTKVLLAPEKIPELTQEIDLSAPAAILKRRPDIIAAERRVAASHASIRAAMANLFPKVSIGWLLGWQTETLQSALFSLQNPDSTLWGIFNAPMLNMSLYRQVTIQKRLKILAILQYQLAIMTALHEIETQYNYCQYSQASMNHLKKAVSQKKVILKLSKEAYQKGFSDFNVVIRSEEDLNHLELMHLHQVVQYQIQRINLYKAMGGDI